jgi:HK97 family phage major capsid protein
MSFSTAERGDLTAQYIRAFVAGDGSHVQAMAFASGRGRAWDTVAEICKTAVAAGGATDQANLRRAIGADIVPLFRPMSILGRAAPFIRRVSFDQRLIALTSGAAGGFVGRGNAIPVGRLNMTASDRLAQLKVACIVPIDAELAKAGSVDANAVITQDLSRALAYVEDAAFSNYLNAGAAGVSPAGIAFGSPTFTIGGNNVAAWDAALNNCVQSVIASGSDLGSAFWVASAKAAWVLASIRDTGGVAYPGVKVRGVGELMGLPFIASSAVEQTGSPLEHFLILVDGRQVWVADAADVEIAMSSVTTLQLSDAPTQSSSTPTPTTQTSMYQTETTAIRATRMVNWAAASANSCAVLRGFTI